MSRTVPFPGRVLLVPLTAWIALQAVTGWLLAAYFRPEPAEALASLHEMQYLVSGGAIVRALHHYGASLLVGTAYAYLLLVLVRGGYVRSRMWGWWSALATVALVAALGFTGYLLPWDNHAYWSMRVGVELIGLVPIVGEPMLELVRGGSSYGAATLHRLYAAHTMLLPVLVMGALLWHWSASRPAVQITANGEET